MSQTSRAGGWCSWASGRTGAVASWCGLGKTAIIAGIGGDPTTPLRSPTWGRTLKRLPAEGFYVLPEKMQFESGASWLKNAIVQLGYNEKGEGIIFVGERHENEETNVLKFSDKGMVIGDDILSRLTWAPILPVKDTQS